LRSKWKKEKIAELEQNNMFPKNKEGYDQGKEISVRDRSTWADPGRRPPDFLWFDDFETRKTLRSAVQTKSSLAAFETKGVEIEVAPARA
jgi:hypothetical protein